MDFKIAVLAGDGIGPEISVQGVDVTIKFHTNMPSVVQTQ